MSIQPLFNGPLLLPSRQLVSASNGQEAETVKASEVDVDGGPKTGNVLDKKDSDFTDPRELQKITTRFSDSINPVTSNTLLVQLGVDPDPLGKNPDSVDILNGTHDIIDLINDPNIGRNVTPRTNSDPLRWINPTALDIFVGVSSTSGSLVTSPDIIATPGSLIIPTADGTVVIPTNGAGSPGGASNSNSNNSLGSASISGNRMNPANYTLLPMNINASNTSGNLFLPGMTALQNSQVNILQNTMLPSSIQSLYSSAFPNANMFSSSMYPLSVLTQPLQQFYQSSAIPQSQLFNGNPAQWGMPMNPFYPLA